MLYLLVNIYEDENAFFAPGRSWTPAERPMRRSVEGQVNLTVKQVSQFEAVLGSKGRSGYQFGAWEAVYGPVGEDGYPRPLWDKRTGKIDREVASYMREHGYDLRAFVLFVSSWFLFLFLESYIYLRTSRRKRPIRAVTQRSNMAAR